MSRTIQSSDYVPGVSGWKFNEVTGEFDIHSSSASTSAEPRLISVTAGSWSNYDLPSNAVECHAFIGAELDKIPAECRASADISTEDISFDRDGSDVRTTLTYERFETCEEVADRIEKASVSAQIKGLDGGGFSIFHNGQLRVRLGSLEAPSPFVVADGKVYLRGSFIDDASITKVKIASEHRSCCEVSEILEMISGNISRTDVAEHMATLIAESRVREVIRAEIRPGGLLHRSR